MRIQLMLFDDWTVGLPLVRKIRNGPRPVDEDTHPKPPDPYFNPQWNKIKRGNTVQSLIDPNLCGEVTKISSDGRNIKIGSDRFWIAANSVVQVPKLTAKK